MRDMQSDLREQGRFVPMRDMSVLAGPKWAKLPERERAIYNARAKAERRGGGGGAAVAQVPPRQGLMDCAGELLSVSVVFIHSRLSFPAHVAIIAYSDLIANC